MRQDPKGQEWEYEARVQAGCVWCGSVEFALDQLRLHATGDDVGLLEFTCPSCSRLNVRALGRGELATLRRLGAEPKQGPAPFELLEEHSGPPITWDDLIDFHEVVTRAERLGRSRVEERPEATPAPERNAA